MLSSVSSRLLVVFTLLLALAAVGTCRWKHSARNPIVASGVTAQPAPVAKADAASHHRAVPAGSLPSPSVDIVHAVHFAPTPTVDPLAALNERCKNEAAWFVRLAPDEQVPERPERPVLMAQRIARDEGVPLDPKIQREQSRGLSEAELAALPRSEPPLMITVAASVKDATAAVEHASRVVACVADATNGLVWDYQTFDLFSAAEFRKRRVDSWISGRPDLTRHFVIQHYTNGDFERAVSGGLAKFGLPELVVSGYTRSTTNQMGHIMNYVAAALYAQGGVITGKVDVDLDAAWAAALTANIDAKPKAKRKGSFELLESERTTGDPDRLLEIGFDGWPGAGLRERQEAAIDGLFGSTDQISFIDYDNPELIAASAHARAQLPALHAKFLHGLPPDERLMVKAPFATTERGKNEWMWIEIVRWKDGRIEGVLRNDPELVVGLKAGADVSVEERAVFDYMLVHANGSREGNETGVVIGKMQKGEGN